MHLSPSPGSLGCCPFIGGGFVVVGLFFYVPLIVSWGSVFIFVLLCIAFYVLSRFAINLTRKRELVALLLLSF